MDCLFCIQAVKYPVGDSSVGPPCHLMELCSYLAKQLLRQSDEVSPALQDMTRREVEQIVQIKVRDRGVNFFPSTFEELSENERCNE